MEIPAALPRLSQRLWLQVVSAFIPGLILLLEFTLIANPDALTRLWTAEPSGFASVVAVLLVLCISYVFGVLNRALTFRLSRTRALCRPGDRPEPDQVLQTAKEHFGSSATAGALAGTSLLDGHGQMREGYFTYCKFWLRHFAPGMSIDSQELEINARFTLSTPVALSLPVVVWVLWMDGVTASWGITLLVAGLLIGVVLACMLLRRGLDGQRYERQDALDFYIATWLVRGNPPPDSPQDRGEVNEAPAAKRVGAGVLRISSEILLGLVSRRQNGVRLPRR